MVVEKDTRATARDEIAQDMDAAGIGRAGSERRLQFLDILRDLEEQKKRQTTKKERRVASFAGIGYGVLGTLVTTGVTWMTGVLQWLLSTLTSKH